jgi:catechol 2,3-dioxygenase-like lactoylglutathione lyase family enzyme
MKIDEIAFVAYPVTDMKRACKFYTDTLGLKESRPLLFLQPANPINTLTAAYR